MIRTVRMLVAAAVAVGLAGCTSMNLFNGPRADASLAQQAEIGVTVGLYVSPEFSKYVFKDKDGGEMSNLNYKLGSASVLLFEDALATAAQGVKVVYSKPPYDGMLKQLSVVVEPSIVKFSQKNPVMTRVGKYSANITYGVKVYDQKGAVILDNTYSGSGVRNGIATVSPGHNYEIAAGLAMQDAVNKAVTEIAATLKK